ncbi:MAG TPA: cytosine permease, partial [Chroococcales cyanobacterium]
SLQQVIWGAAISCLILFAYSLTASYVGAYTGLNFSLLSQHTFGVNGSKFVSACQTFLFLLWYAMIAVFIAEAVKGLFPSAFPIEIVAAVAALLMAANNLFGFAGVANFARYIAAPVLIAWISFVFAKAACATPHTVLAQAGSADFTHAVSLISSFVIGYSVWGNEPDFWRFGRPEIGATAWPLALAIAFGQIVFPITGWLLAALSGITDQSSAAALVNNYAFNGFPAIAAIVLAVTYFATGDANLYGAINAVQNFRSTPRRRLVIEIMMITAVCAAIMTRNPKAFETLASFNAVLLPCVMLIIAVNFLLFKKTVEAAQSRHVVWNSLIPVLAAWAVGIVTAGVLPGTDRFHCGIWPLYAWLTGVSLYIVLHFTVTLPLPRKSAKQPVAVLSNPDLVLSNSDLVLSNSDPVLSDPAIEQAVLDPDLS